MSTIEKMSIQGIRSFGPEDKDKQMIHFFTPLTLILGPNGTGKTTVIECLKYMTTGIMPPGSKGAAFIHDPKVAHEREVKGQVRLQFQDVSKQRCIVQRSMLATQKQKKIEMKTLDGVITRYKGGEKHSITSRCAEVDREMITSLGVSKAVLENVIFCHQEDANWPLSEGKTLKEKFDAIFASTRYVKALENIRKIKQDQDQQIKLFKTDIVYLKQHKDKAAELEGDLNELQAKLAASKESVEKINTNLKPVEEKLEQINARANDIFKVQNNITKLTTEKDTVEKTVKELQDNIENEYQGSTDQLKRILSEFQDKLQDKRDTLQQFEKRQLELDKDLDKLIKEKNKLLMEVGRLEQEAEHHEQNRKKRDELVKNLAEQYAFAGLSHGEVTDEKYRSFLENMRHKLETMVNEGKQIKVEFDEKEAAIQRKIDDLKESKTKLEQNERIKRNMVSENNNKIRQINNKLSEVEASAGKRDQLNRDLKRNEHELQTLESSVNVDEVRKELTQLSKEKTEKDSVISELSSEMNRLHLQSNAQAQLDVLKKDKAAKEETVRRLKAKHEDTVNYLLGHIPSKNIRGRMDEYIDSQTEDVKRSGAEVQKSKTQLSTRETEKKMSSDDLRKKEEKLKDLEEKIFSVCGSQSFDEGLQNVQQKLAHSQDQRGSLVGAEHFFKKYVDDLEKDDPCCPLCHREFDTGQEVRELVLELRNKLRLVPAKREKADHDLDEFQNKYDALMQLKPLKENISILQEKEIPELKTKLKKTNEEIDRLRTDIQDKEDSLRLKEDDEIMAKQIQPDIVMMDRYQGEITELDKKIATQASMLSGGDSGRTLQDVINEKEDIQMKVDTITRQLDHKRQKLSDHSDQVQRLKSQINMLREEKLRIDSNLQQRYKLEEDKATLLSENDKHESDIKEASEQVRPLQTQIDKLKKEKEKVAALKEEKLEDAKTEVDRVKNEGNKVKNINQDMKVYNQTGRAEMLKESQQRKSEIQSKITTKEEDSMEVSQNIDKLRKDLSTQQVRERELSDNLQLRKKLESIAKLEEQIDEENVKLGGFDPRNLERERKKLKQQQDEYERERHIAAGRQRGFEDEIKSKKKELQSDMYKGAPEKYRDKMITLRTTELASGDLEKYYKALDTAIMKYHSMKMEEINKIIRELWRNTYRGNDIETIEIKSDEDESTSMKTRRTYNYRVVMIKGDTALDMRGRCSAGQKVLASLIIRMALAETFCLNCGILALDEPTTNLDRENIESLAYALVEIIKTRSAQRNFQLVVITHDEDFVELLGRSDYVDDFYKVGKDQFGCSRLTMAKVETLHA